MREKLLEKKLIVKRRKSGKGKEREKKGKREHGVKKGKRENGEKKENGKNREERKKGTGKRRSFFFLLMIALFFDVRPFTGIISD